MRRKTDEVSRRDFLVLVGGAALVSVAAARHTQRVVHVEDFGARGDGSHDDVDAIQSAHDHAQSRGGGVVRLGGGVFRTSRPLLWSSGVSLVGVSATASTLRPIDVHGSAITGAHGFSVAAPFRDATFARFAIDGAGMSSHGYDTGRKGIFIQHLANVVFRDLIIRDTPATGLGIDFLRDVVIERVLTERCGREYRPGAGGGAGIGIGTGATAVEGVVVRHCRAIGNGSHGIFFERQPGAPHVPTGARVITCVASANGQHGIMDSGCQGMLARGCTSTGNGKSGFACGQSELGVPGRSGEVRESRLDDNREHGAVFAATGDGAAAGYQLIANRIRGNGASGVALYGLREPVADTRVVDNELARNSAPGVEVAGAAGAAALVVRGNHLVDNGARDHGPAIHLAADVTALDVEDNWFSDDQASPTQGPAVLVGAGVTIRGGVLGANHTDRNPGGNVSVQGRLVGVRT